MKKLELKYIIPVCIVTAAALFGCATAGQAQEEAPAAENASLTDSMPKEKTPEEIKEEYITNMIDGMTLEEKAGQLLMVAWRKDADGNNITEINEGIISDISNYKPGGATLFSENIDEREQTIQLIADMQEESGIPLFIGIDEEGGRVSRLSVSGNIDYIKPAAAGELGAENNPDLVYSEMSRVADKLAELGFNVDFAPVADINTNPENPVIGDRAYGSDAGTVSEMTAAAVRGLQDGGISAAAKHFPGHGDTSTDTHNIETFVQHDMERLRQVELAPFARAAQEGVDFIMAAHIKTPNATGDGLPASMSGELINGILRTEMGYNGIVITDALDMGAITGYYDTETIVKNCVEAGVDIMLMPSDIGEFFDSLLNLISSGELKEERLDESLRRILSVKYDRGLIGG